MDTLRRQSVTNSPFSTLARYLERCALASAILILIMDRYRISEFGHIQWPKFRGYGSLISSKVFIFVGSEMTCSVPEGHRTRISSILLASPRPK